MGIMVSVDINSPAWSGSQRLHTRDVDHKDSSMILKLSTATFPKLKSIDDDAGILISQNFKAHSIQIGIP